MSPQLKAVLREKLEPQLLLALTKVKVEANKLGGLHYDVPDDALDGLFAALQPEIERLLVEARKTVLQDISQRISYDEYSGLEPSKAWKKMSYHIEGSLNAVKRQQLAQSNPEEETDAHS